MATTNPTLNWAKSQQFASAKGALIAANVPGTDWMSFLDAIGWMENSGNYGGHGGAGGAYSGMYQVGSSQLGYEHFLAV